MTGSGGSAVLQGLLDNKREYTDHLCDVLGETLLQEFADAYDRIRQNPVRRGNVLSLFQSSLAEIPEWNASRVRSLYQSVRERSGCAYIGDLVKGILITCVKIQVVSHGSPSETSRKIKLRVPSAENFTHACMVAAARSFWKRPYLFYHEVRSLERQHNLVQAEGLIKTAVKNTLRSYLPMDQLMQVVPLAGGDMPPDPILREGDAESEDDEAESASDADDAESEAESASAATESDDADDDDDDAVSEEPFVNVAKAPAPLSEPEPESESESDSYDDSEPEPEPESPPRATAAPTAPKRDADSLGDSTEAPSPFLAFADPEADARDDSGAESESDDGDVSLNMSDLERIVEDAPAESDDGGAPEFEPIKKLSIDSGHAEAASDSEADGDSASGADADAERDADEVRVIPLQASGASRGAARLQKPLLDRARMLRPVSATIAKHRADGAFF